MLVEDSLDFGGPGGAGTVLWVSPPAVSLVAIQRAEVAVYPPNENHNKEGKARPWVQSIFAVTCCDAPVYASPWLGSGVPRSLGKHYFWVFLAEIRFGSAGGVKRVALPVRVGAVQPRRPG